MLKYGIEKVETYQPCDEGIQIEISQAKDCIVCSSPDDSSSSMHSAPQSYSGPGFPNTPVW